MSGCFTCAILVLGLMAAPEGEGEAEEDVAARKTEAGEHLDRGNELLQSGQAAEALDAYRAAYDAYPSPKIYFNIAEAERELGRLVEAAENYQRVVDEVEPESPLVGAAQEKLDALDQALARVTVSTDPQGAEVRVGDRVLGLSPILDARVEPGMGVEVAVLLGDRRQTRTVDLVAGESQAVSISLIEIAPPPPPPPPIVEEPLTSKWWFWTAIGAGIVAAGTAVGVAVATSGDGFDPNPELGTFPFRDFQPRP